MDVGDQAASGYGVDMCPVVSGLPLLTMLILVTRSTLTPMAILCAPSSLWYLLLALVVSAAGER